MYTDVYMYIHIYIYICIIPAKIRRLETSGGFPMDMRIPPLRNQTLLQSNPSKSRILARRLAAAVRALL